MQEYRVKGLTCVNCTRELEEQIQKLEHGDDAQLHYTSGKLVINPNVSIEQVAKILKTDGAYIDKQASGYHAHDHSVATHDHDHDHSVVGKMLLYQLIVATVFYVVVMFFHEQLPLGVAIGGYLFAIAISGYRTFWKGIKNLLQLKFNIDTLMTIALTGAVAIGEWKEATLVAILFGLNEWLEGLGMERARRSMEALLEVAPKEARLLIDGAERIVPIASLQVGDTVLIRSGDKIPSDGIVVEGKSSVNEAAITGESLPIDKDNGDHVYGGSINNEGILKVRIEKEFKDSSLARILHLVEDAQETKTPTELFINRFAKYYTPLIMVISLLLILVPPLFGGDWGKWLYQGLAVLIVGCPCALILSSPIALVAGITHNARNGILVKGGVFLEQLGKIDTLAFDKTGTLTKGEPYVEQVIAYEEQRFYEIAVAVEKSSSHPLARAIMKELGTRDIAVMEPDSIETNTGRGIVAVIQGDTYWLGNEQIITHITFAEQVKRDIEQLKEKALTLVIIADQEHVLGMFGIADEIREESREVIASLHHHGIAQTVMLTGDHPKTAEKVARSVGVSSFYAGLLPEEKVGKVEELKQTGKVAMIGDGINDAPALATAHLGIAMGKGTDSAIETADIVLMQDHLGKLPEAIGIAKRVNRIIRLNISIALGLKAIALLLTIPGMLTLWMAILSDMGATILVTLISLTVLVGGKWSSTKQLI